MLKMALLYIYSAFKSTRIGSEFLIASEKAVIMCDNLNIDMNELSSGQINQDHLARSEADRHNIREDIPVKRKKFTF